MNTKTQDIPKAITIEINEKELFKGKLSGDLEASLDECTKSIDQIKSLRKKLVKELWPGYDWMSHSMDFYWKCEHSPFGWCAYDYQLDRAHDYCLFCGGPSERK